MQPGQLVHLAQLEFSGTADDFDHAEWIINDLRAALPPHDLSMKEHLLLLGENTGRESDEFALNLLLTRVLRPVNNAISITFTGSLENWPPKLLHTLQATVAKWPGCKQLPLYGPQSAWDDIHAAGPVKRSLGAELEAAIVEIAHASLPKEFFRRLNVRAKRMQVV